MSACNLRTDVAEESTPTKHPLSSLPHGPDRERRRAGAWTNRGRTGPPPRGPRGGWLKRAVLGSAEQKPVLHGVAREGHGGECRRGSREEGARGVLRTAAARFCSCTAALAMHQGREQRGAVKAAWAWARVEREREREKERKREREKERVSDSPQGATRARVDQQEYHRAWQRKVVHCG